MRNPQHKKLVFSAMLGLVMTSTAPAFAMTDEPSVDALRECQKLKRGGTRLTCYDRVMGELFPADADPEQFGRHTPSLADDSLNLLAEAAEQDPELDVVARKETGEVQGIALRVAEITETSRDRYRITMTNGQIWRTTDLGRMRMPRKVPDGGILVEIRKGALNSFKLSFVGRNGFVRVRRVDTEE